MKKLSKFPFIISLIIISFSNSWTLESLWEYTLKNKGKSKFYYLSDPDNILTEKEIRDMEGNMLLLYNQWTVNSFFFIINKLDSPSIDDEYLESIINSLYSKVEKELLLLTNNTKNTFVSLIIANNKVTKYKLGEKLMKRATKNELERMKQNSLRKFKEEDRVYKVFLSQISSIEYIIDGDDDVIPGWDDWPYPTDDPDDLDNPDDYPDVEPKRNTNYKLPTSIYIIIIIFLVVLVLFLIWLFFSLAKRVRQMSSGRIDYNMFPNGEIDLKK